MPHGFKGEEQAGVSYAITSTQTYNAALRLEDPLKAAVGQNFHLHVRVCFVTFCTRVKYLVQHVSNPGWIFRKSACAGMCQHKEEIIANLDRQFQVLVRN